MFHLDRIALTAIAASAIVCPLAIAQDSIEEIEAAMAETWKDIDSYSADMTMHITNPMDGSKNSMSGILAGKRHADDNTKMLSHMKFSGHMHMGGMAMKMSHNTV